MTPSDVRITVMDRALFAACRFYNRTFGVHVLSWSHDRLTIFGISIMAKHAVDALHSKQAHQNLRAGLSDDEYQEVCQALAMISILPKPALPDGSFSDRQKADYGIRLVWKRYYVFRT
ncbi:hypothetical protein ACO0K7_17050 [Undibacterium sp. Ji67W]|uniref:hypothetical protein n=1 Tax=Undibacterium sp. Ji67W TaxID=3413042 RepID=UPI003BF3946D